MSIGGGVWVSFGDEPEFLQKLGAQYAESPMAAADVVSNVGDESALLMECMTAASTAKCCSHRGCSTSSGFRRCAPAGAWRPYTRRAATSRRTTSYR